MQFNLKTTVPSQILPDSDYLETFRFPNGRALPVSYRLFAEQYGWGRTLDNFLIYLPVRDAACDSWQQARQNIKSTYSESK